MPNQDAGETFGQPPYIHEALIDAESLLKFASESGSKVDDKTRDAVLSARAKFHTGFEESIAANLLIALATLAKIASPVTAESLKEYHRSEKRPPNHTYRIPAIILAVIIIVYSTWSFISSAIAKSISDDINTANELAVRLTTEFLESPNPTPSTSPLPQLTTACGAVAQVPPSLQNKGNAIRDFQSYAATIRDIYTRAKQLNTVATFRIGNRDPIISDPELELVLPVNYSKEACSLTVAYQKVRRFGQTEADQVLTWYGAVSSCVLPVLYALLGAAAYLLRIFEKSMGEKAYVPSAADSARFVVAAIGGAVVGLFNGFTITQTKAVSPLALAFLVGYAVDVFYKFLENLIQSFTKSALASVGGGAASGSELAGSDPPQVPTAAPNGPAKG